MLTFTVWFDAITKKEIVRDGWRYPPPDAGLFEKIKAQHGIPSEALIWQTTDAGSVPDGPMVLVDGAPQIDPEWQPPVPEPDPLADILARVDKLPVSEHSLLAEEQKAFLKIYAIPWVKAHPTASPTEAVAAITDALEAEFPNDPLVGLIYWVSPKTGREHGLLMSYARAAVRLGAIPSPTWVNLRALILGSTEAQLRQMLRKL